MRKILYLFLAFAMTVSAAVMPISAEETADAFAEKKDEKAETAEAVGKDSAAYLTALGAEYLEEANLSAPASRKEFARLVSLIGGYTPDESKGGIFLDVEPSAETEAEDFSGYINALANAGVVSKGGGWFEPDRNITPEEAATMLVRILGYSYLADEKGGFPTGYMLASNNLGLFDNTGISGKEISMGQALKLCTNALDTDMMRQVKYGDDGEYRKDEGYTLAFDVFGIVHQKGIVESVDLSALKGKNATSPYYMTIDGISVYVNDYDTHEYLGYAVEAFYKYDRKATRNSLVWIKKSEDNYETEVAVEDVKGIDSGRFEYYNDNNKTKTKSFNPLLPVIYNGTATGEAFDMSIISGKQGKIRLLDNNNDNTVDVVFIEAYTDLVVGSVSTSDKRVYDANNSSKYLDIDTRTNYPYTVLYDTLGKEISLAEIGRGTVLSVFDYKTDADQGYLKIYASNTTADGKIEKIVKKDGSVRVTVGGKEYRLTDDCEMRCINKLTPGSNVILRLDYYGYAADVKASDALSFGYLIAAKLEKSLDNWYRFRIYTTEDEVKEYTAANRIGLNNNTYDNGDITLLNSLVSSSHVIYPGGPADCTAQAIRYRLNDKGEVAYIDTVYTKDGIPATADTIESDDALYMGASGNYRYREGGYIFGGKFLAKSTTMFLGCPLPGGKTDFTDSENYMFAPIKTFVGGSYYTATPYYVSDNSMAADFVVYDNEGAASISETTYLCVVKQVEKYWEKNENYTRLVIVGRNGEESTLCKEDMTFSRGTAASTAAESLPATLRPTDLKAGDVIRYTSNQRGYVTNIILYYRLADSMPVTSVSDSFNSSFSLYYGYPLRKTEDGLSLYKTENKGDLDSVTDSMCEIVPRYNYCSYIIYDSNWKDGKENVSAASYEDIIAYKDSKLDCTKMVVQTDIGTPRIMIIVK